MNETTIKPASPLPWVARGDVIYANKPFNGDARVWNEYSITDLARGPDERRANAVYAAHAANAYPELVEALKKLADESHGVANSVYLSGTQEKSSVSYHLNRAVEAARAILAKCEGGGPQTTFMEDGTSTPNGIIGVNPDAR